MTVISVVTSTFSCFYLGSNFVYVETLHKETCLFIRVINLLIINVKQLMWQLFSVRGLCFSFEYLILSNGSRRTLPSKCLSLLERDFTTHSSL